MYQPTDKLKHGDTRKAMQLFCDMDDEINGENEHRSDNGYSSSKKCLEKLLHELEDHRVKLFAQK